MKNGICMRAVTNSVENELSHHGILGMSWGKRFGPPYPLGGVDKKVARAEAKRKKQQEKRVAALQKAAKKARKAKVKAAKKEKKELERQVKINEQKQKLLEEDNYKKIMKNHKLFTSEELKYVKDRHDQQIADKLDRMINRAAKVTTLVNTVSNVSQGLKMLQGLRQQSKLNALEIQKFQQDVANKKQLAESTKNIAEQNKYKAEQEKQKSVQEMHKVTQEYFKGQKEKQSAYADAYSKFNQSYKDFFETEKTKKEYSDWINQNAKSDRKVYTLKNATVSDILNRRNSTHESEFNSKAAYTFKPSDVNISQLANRHAQSTPVSTQQQVMETRISDLSRSPYTSAMATTSGRPYANRTINNMLNNMTTEYYQRQIPSTSELKEMLKNSKGNYSFYNMLL